MTRPFALTRATVRMHGGVLLLVGDNRRLIRGSLVAPFGQWLKMLGQRAWRFPSQQRSPTSAGRGLWQSTEKRPGSIWPGATRTPVISLPPRERFTLIDRGAPLRSFIGLAILGIGNMDIELSRFATGFVAMIGDCVWASYKRSEWQLFLRVVSREWKMSGRAFAWGGGDGVTV